jgi:hypothetical protein
VAREVTLSRLFNNLLRTTLPDLGSKGIVRCQKQSLRCAPPVNTGRSRPVRSSWEGPCMWRIVIFKSNRHNQPKRLPCNYIAA